MIYNKLVRNKIPTIMADNGQKAFFRILDEAEYKECLEKKLDEEVAEFHESKSVEELADIFEVMNALCELHGYTLDDMLSAYCDKHNERGGFNKRVFLISTEDAEEK